MKRNYGIDLLRIISMLMVVVLHILGHGGVLSNSLGINYWVTWFVEIVCFCAVNCYALISGYVGVQSKYKISNGIYIWLQAAFYTFVISIMFLTTDFPLLNKGFLIQSILPVCTQQYWYLTAYLGLFIFMPLLNYVLNYENKNQLTNIIVFMIILFSVLPTLLRNDLFKLNYGFSMMWLIILYFIGGYIRLYGFPFIDNKRKGIIVYIACVLFTLFAKYLIEIPISNYLGDFKGGGVFILYTSPTILFSGIGLLVFFSQLELKEKMIKFVKYVSPSTFGVYLIHEFYLIRENFISNKFASYADSNFIIMLFQVITTAFIIFTLCICIDRIRLFIFNKLRIKEKLNHLDCKIINE